MKIILLAAIFRISASAGASVQPHYAKIKELIGAWSGALT